jgi:hypothetical protein
LYYRNILFYQNAHPFLTSAGIENPTGKMAIGQISEALFLLIPVFFVRYGFKKTILVGIHGQFVTLCSPMEMVVI